mgnify:CR=1 FL=1
MEDMRTPKYILEVNNLKKYFVIETNLFGKPLRYLKAVDNVSFKVERGTTLGIVGESGCGKTTLGRTILKLHDSNGGSIIYDGDDITNLSKSQMIKYRTKMQLIFQDPYSSLPPRMTVGNIIAEAVKVHKIVSKDKVSQHVRDIMTKCGLPVQYYDRYPHEFSGGQRQRICIARALAVNPKLVICDEPVSALDVSIQAQIINLLKDLQTTMGLTYVFISIFQIPDALLIASSIAVWNIIPTVGFLIGFVPAFVLLLFTNATLVIPFTLIMFLIYQIDCNIISPRIVGYNTGVGPLCVIVAISTMGALLGLVGLIIAVPLFATLIAFGDDIIRTRLQHKRMPDDTENYFAPDLSMDYLHMSKSQLGRFIV